MAMSVDEQRIREKAYEIWQAEGCPIGEETRHWEKACKQAEAELEAEVGTNAAAKVEESEFIPMPTSSPAEQSSASFEQDNQAV
ncbi:DUF2934 domain-containing protein [Azotobacter chroococcum]|uniref:DUF2934 family protein n=1 Tax=Azotobacter chroococcum TaxID=353 RepID=A0A4R1PMM3_9GAMM|nr:DUF2934 family protein [Azotobacter chroococcum]